MAKNELNDSVVFGNFQVDFERTASTSTKIPKELVNLSEVYQRLSLMFCEGIIVLFLCAHLCLLESVFSFLIVNYPSLPIENGKFLENILAINYAKFTCF